MKFKKYTSIENVERSKYIKMTQDAIMLGYCENDFIVEEKIHGANFTFFYNGEELKIAKRTSMIKEEENFYGAQSLIPKYEIILKPLFDKLNKPIRLVGELYGGSYPHNDVEKTKASAVQRGVFYRPDVEFIAYELYVLDDGAYILLDKETQYELFNEFNIFHTEPLFRGTLEKCLEYSNEFQTTIPTKLGLPEIENNICEGVVIKPVKPSFFKTGSRIIFKNKNEKFREKSKTKKVSVNKNVKLTIEEKEGLENRSQYLTENRLRNVLSKIGEVTSKDFGKLLGLFVQDALEDYEKEYEDEVLDKDSIKKVNKLMNKVASDILRENFLNIMDGEF